VLWSVREGKGLNSSVHESVFLKLVIILKNVLHSEYFNTIRGVTPQKYAIGYDRMYIREI